MAAEPKAPPAPPHLRAATDEKECEVCTYFARGHCTEYPPLVVDGEWTCDTFKPSGRSDVDDVKPRSLKAAGAEARDVMRAAKK